jgi:hypothetical protein
VQELQNRKKTSCTYAGEKLKIELIMLEVKDYSKQELADALYAGNIKPESRLRKLWREVNGCPDLLRDLQRLHYHSGDSGFTAQMVERIKYWLCID